LKLNKAITYILIYFVFVIYYTSTLLL